MEENDEEKLNKEEERESKYTNESESLNSKTSIRSSSVSSIGSQISIHDKSVINKITSEINSYKNKNNNILDENNEEILENASNGLIQYLSTSNNISLLSIEDSLKNSLINYYCNQQDYFCLKVILISIEKQNNDKSILNSYFLKENNNNMNVFETSSELGDIKIFYILKKYLTDNKNILEELIKPNRDNIFHIAAKNNQIISLLFYYHFYKSKYCIEIPNDNLETPLHLCCHKNYYEFSNILVNLGINMDLQDKEGKTALFYASEKQSFRIIKNLLLNGANKYIKDKNNKKCIDYINVKKYNSYDIDYDDKNKIVYNILEDKNICVQLFKCPIIYQSLKESNKHIIMLSTVIILIIFQIIILSIFLTYIHINNNIDNNKYFNNNKNNIIELILILIDLFTEILLIIISLIFSYKKNKKTSFNNNTNERKKELYELYEENNNINFKLCVKCSKLIGPNTKHCISCDKCITNWDHHCFWLNTCINSQNSKYFKIFLINTILSLILNMTTCIFIFIEIYNFPKIYYIFIMKDEIKNENDFDYISIIAMIIDCLFFLFYLIILISFIIPFIFNGICDNDENSNTPKKITKEISIGEKLINSSSNT